MRNVLIILIMLIVGSCAEDTAKSYKKDGYRVKVIDSCEYIVVDEGLSNNRVYGISHKGNCVFCAQRK